MFCGNCGTTLSNNATFCPMCGHQVSAAPMVAMSQQMSPAPVYASAQAMPAIAENATQWSRDSYTTPRNTFKTNAKQGLKGSASFGLLQIVRCIAVVFLAISMFLPWVVNEMSMLGHTESASMSYLDLVNPLGTFLFIAGVAAAAAGTALELFAKRGFGKWISVAGFAVIAVLAVLVVANMSQSVGNSYASESVAPTFVAWLSLILSGAGIATCIIKH